MVRFVCIALLFLLMIQIEAWVIKAQQDEEDAPNSETYREVLDIVFPKDNLNGVFGYGFVLRFVPSFDAESQINIKNRSGDIEVTEYKAVGESIYYQIIELYKRGVVDEPQTLAKQIRFEKRSVAISPSTVKRWRESYYQSLGASSNYERKKIGEKMKVTTNADDGTKYQLWYHGASDIFYELSGGPSADTLISYQDSALANWMKGIKKQIGKSK